MTMYVRTAVRARLLRRSAAYYRCRECSYKVAVVGDGPMVAAALQIVEDHDHEDPVLVVWVDGGRVKNLDLEGL